MLNTILHRGAAIALLILVAACGSSEPSSPVGSSLPPATNTSTAPPATVPTGAMSPVLVPLDIPPLSGSSRTFEFASSYNTSVSECTKTSRFVLYDNGAFVSSSACGGGNKTRGDGKYTEANGVITFIWEGTSEAPSGAVGTLTGDTLVVEYNMVMLLSDFENAVYRLTAPSTQVEPIIATPPATDFPPLSGPSRTFYFASDLSWSGVSDYTKTSRFILYDNGAFVLEYPTLGTVGYAGKYTEANGIVTFEWQGWSTAGPWGAIGTLTGDTLAVQYNLIMALTDFENAMYRLTR